MGNNEKPLGRKENLVVQELNGEILIYDLSENKAFCLNETSARVWQACNGQNSITDINRAIGDDDIVWLALSELKRERLIEHESVRQHRFDDMTRREVIKKIGLGSMILLPVVASLVAPRAADAASCIANDGTCSASAQCCSKCCKNVGGGVNQCKPGGGAYLP